MLFEPLRQVNTAFRIANRESTTQLNSKAEWHGPATVRLVADGGGGAKYLDQAEQNERKVI